jgi:hypothetical protein
LKKLLILAIIAGALLVPMSASAITYDSILTLENKDTTTWAVIADGRIGTLNYNASGPTFNYLFTATGLEATTAYSLIYYANPYPGNNPGALIGTGTSAADGTLTITGTPNLNKHLPSSPDANMLIDHSAPPDNYAHPYGAKIWLVPSACYSGTSVTVWSPTRFLFETDMMNYTDTDYSGTGLPLTVTVTEPVATIGLSVSPPSVAFGSVAMGSCSADVPVTLTNTGNVPIKVLATTTAGFYTDCLKINTLTANGWISSTIPVGGNQVVLVKVCPTVAYSGTLTGSVSFMASFAP